MAIGIFRKIGDFAKKVFSKGKEVIGRLLPAIAPVVSMIPHPAAKAIGTALTVAQPAISTLMNSSDSRGAPNSAPQRNNVSGMLEFNRL